MDNRNTNFVRLDHLKRGQTAEAFMEFAGTKVIGQSHIIKTIGQTIEQELAGFSNPKKPIGSFFIAGPSGVGKTSIIKALAEFLFEDEKAMTRLEGQEFSEPHSVANLKGSPAGYVGFDEPPRITQEGLDKYGFNAILDDFYSRLFPGEEEFFQEKEAMIRTLVSEINSLTQRDAQTASKRESCMESIKALQRELAARGYPLYDITGSRSKYISVFLIDEVERADKALWNLLYTPLDEAYLPIKGYKRWNGSVVDKIRFNSTFFFATSNVGDDVIRELLNVQSGKSTGFKFHHSSVSKNVAQEVYSSCKKEVRRHFQSSFIGRFDHFFVAQPLFRLEIRQVVDLKISELNKRLANKLNFRLSLDVDEKAREFIVDESADDPTIGARLVEQKIKRRLTDSLVSLTASKQITDGDRIFVRLETLLDRPVLTFYREEYAAKPLLVQKDLAGGRP